MWVANWYCHSYSCFSRNIQFSLAWSICWLSRKYENSDVEYAELTLTVQTLSKLLVTCLKLWWYLSLDHRPCMSLGSFSIFVVDLLWWCLKDFGSLIYDTGRFRTPRALHAWGPYKSLSFGGAGYADDAGNAHCPRCDGMKLKGTRPTSLSCDNTLRK